MTFRIFLVSCYLFLSQALVFADSTNVVTNVSVWSEFTGITNYSFENYTDTLENGSIETIDQGSLSIEWNSFEIDAILYREIGSDWNEKVLTNGKNEVVLDSLTENKHYQIAFKKSNELSEIYDALTLNQNVFQNFETEGKPEKVKLSWNLKYDMLFNLDSSRYTIGIKYITKIDKKRLEADPNSAHWTYIDNVNLYETSYTIEGLAENENYIIKLGLLDRQSENPHDSAIWSDKSKVKTERGWGIFKFLVLIGSLGFFIYGMKVMSEGIQQAAGGNLRKMLGAMTSNRFKGVLTGFGITSIVQSSSVTTVMTVSFVNAGLMTLKESVGVMMGANVGTTLTGWLVLIVGFKINIGDYALFLLAFAAPMLFVNKRAWKAWAEAIFGFCILFLGLGFLKEAVPELTQDSALVQFFLEYKSAWYGPVMFVVLGTLVTIIIQSSSAAMALTLTMVSKGVIPFEVACAMILGENIGTTITATLASLIANVHAKRAARIHMLFNVVGVVWMLLVFPWFIQMLSYFVEGDPFTNNEAANTGIAMFHTVFNILNLLLLVWFVPQLVRFAIKTVPSKTGSDEDFKLDFIGGPLGATAELNVLEVKKEVAKFGRITSRMNTFVHTLINSVEKKEKAKLYEKLEKYEEITDRVEVEIGDYLGKTAQLEMSEDASARTRGMLSITTDLERIGDIFYQMGKSLERKDSKKQWFSPEQRKGLNDMSKLIGEAFEIMNENLNKEFGTADLQAAAEKESEINLLRNKLRKQHLRSFKKDPDYHLSSSITYNNLFSSFEKVGDHIINVSEAVSGEN